MEVSLNDKNKSIAEMLGWIYLPSNRTELLMIPHGWWKKKPIEGKKYHPKLGNSDYVCRTTNQLGFERDFNMLFEAIEILKESYLISITIAENIFDLEVYSPLITKININYIGTTPKDAMFQSLYQLSLKLKDVNHSKLSIVLMDITKDKEGVVLAGYNFTKENEKK